MDSRTFENTAVTADVLNQKWSFEIPPEAITDDQITNTYTADIVVVGAGLAGLCTACSALDAGAKNVVVVTASSKPIGRGGSNNGIGTKYQKSLGVDSTPKSAARLVKVTQAMSSFAVDTSMWGKWINNSGESVDWMCDIMNAKGLKTSLEFGYDDPDGITTEAASSHTFWNEKYPNGALTGATLQAKAYADTIIDMGGTIHYNTKAEQLVRENNNTGRISAVIAKDSNGNYVKFAAEKAVVLATGDFSKDRDMMAKYSPMIYKMFENKISWDKKVNYDASFAFNGLYPGDGHKMGLWVGAAWQKNHPNAAIFHTDFRVPFPSVAGHAAFWGVSMDIRGKRFMNENCNIGTLANVLYHLPEQKLFMVWDSAYAYTREKWNKGTVMGYVNGIPATTPEELVASWEKAASQGSLLKGDTIEALLAQFQGLGLVDIKTADKTIEDWNTYCDNGYDEEFQDNPKILNPVRTAPFYGAFLDGNTSGNMLVSICGGLRTNANMQVCEEDDTPIQGLYNTGIMTGDFYANMYTLVCFGQNLGAVNCTLSYLLGRDLAAL